MLPYFILAPMPGNDNVGINLIRCLAVFFAIESKGLPRFDQKEKPVRLCRNIQVILAMLGMLALSTMQLALASPSEFEAESEMTAKLSAGTGNLAFRLLANLATKEAAHNLLVSPASLAVALTLAYNGASGETAKEMAETLGLTGVSVDKVNKAQAALIDGLETADPSVQLISANALWLKNGVKLSPAFAEHAKNYFKSDVSSLDFADPRAIQVINNWVAEHTKNKIKSILDQLDATCALVITNAVYFKGAWLKPFSLEATEKDGQFTSASGERLKIAMMQQSGSFQYAEDPTAQVIELPYGNGQVAMYIFLPRDPAKYQNFVTSFTLSRFETVTGKLRHCTGSIKLPRFSISFGDELSKTFKSLGMKTAFDPHSADFKKMAQVSFPFYIGQLLHKAVMNVNEFGTEAAASTAITMLGSAYSPAKPFVMNVDHPFVLAICERDTKAILFLAAVAKPEKLEAPQGKSTTH
jgi:serpin B